MINISSAFRKQLNNDNRRYIKSCDITLSDGTTLYVDNSFIWSNGFKVEDSVSGEESFAIGSAIVGKFTLILNNIYDDYSGYDFTDAVVSNIKVELELDDGTAESVKKGVFTVDETTYNGSIITLQCLDNMSKFDRPYSQSNQIYPATLGAIVRDACSCCGVSLAADSASFDKDDYVVQTRPDDGSLTFRHVLCWVGQISCHWCRCNENGELSLGWYDTTTLEKIQSGFDGGTMNPWTSGDTLDGGTMNPWTTGDTIDGGSFDWNGYHHIYSLSSMNICTDDVVITGIRITEKTDGESDIIYQNGSSGYVLSIESNDFIQGGKGAAVAEYLGTKLIGLRFRPLSVSCLSDPSIEAGDVAIVSDRKGNSYPTLITSTTFTAGNYQQISCDAETPLRNSAQRFSESTRIYQEIRKRLSRQKTEWEKAIEKLGEKLSESSGLYSTIVTQEDGSKIYYLHDKSTLEESMVVWKMNAQAWGVSTDGGKTWNGGMTVDGEAIARILNTIGLNADWIDTGAFVVKDADGNILFRADVDTGRVDIVADSFQLRGKTIEEITQKELNDFVSSVFHDTVTNLQAQIDGQIETFYFDYEPLLANEPASNWETEAEKAKHEGDLFYWKSRGFSYRFMKDGTDWKWQLVQDTDITKAMEQAAKAQDTADGKRRVFLSTPTPPYDEGDLWATSTEDGKASIKICKSGRAAGSFSSSDWIDPKYVDGSDVENAISNYDTSLGQTEVFHKLTNGGKSKGIYQENGELYINASYILAGILAGKFINAKGIKVLDSDNNITFYIDDNGDVTIRAKAFSLEGKTVQSIAESASSDAMNDAKEYTDEKIESLPDQSGNLIKGYRLSESDAAFWDISGTITYGISDPAGGTQAVKLYGTTSDNFISANRSRNQVLYSAGRYTVSVWLKSDSARTIKISLNRYMYECVLSTEWQKFSFTANVSAVSDTAQLFTIGGWGSVASGSTIYAYHPEVVFEYTSEDYFNMLTNNGVNQGIYIKDGKIFLNGEFLKAASVDAEKLNVSDLYALGAKIAKWLIYANYIQSSDGTITLYSDGRIKIGNAVLSAISNAMTIKYGLHVYAGSDSLSDGSDQIKFFNLSHVTSGGQMVFGSDGSTVCYLSSSSRRYKNHVSEMTDEEARRILEIPVIWFRYKNGYLNQKDWLNGKKIPGFYAEDVFEKFPEGAQLNQEGEPEDWNYRTMIPAMLKLIQIQSEEISEMGKKMETLEDRIRILEQTIGG